MNTNQVNQISIDNWTFKLFYKVNLLTNVFLSPHQTHHCVILFFSSS